MGPNYIAYIVQEMPHLTVTIPLVIITLLYLWSQKLEGRRERLICERGDLKPKMREQEKLLRETIDPKLYDTFKRMVMQDEQEEIEKMR